MHEDVAMFLVLQAEKVMRDGKLRRLATRDKEGTGSSRSVEGPCRSKKRGQAREREGFQHEGTGRQSKEFKERDLISWSSNKGLKRRLDVELRLSFPPAFHSLPPPTTTTSNALFVLPPRSDLSTGRRLQARRVRLTG